MEFELSSQSLQSKTTIHYSTVIQIIHFGNILLIKKQNKKIIFVSNLNELMIFKDFIRIQLKEKNEQKFIPCENFIS